MANILPKHHYHIDNKRIKYGRILLKHPTNILPTSYPKTYISLGMSVRTDIVVRADGLL